MKICVFSANTGPLITHKQSVEHVNSYIHTCICVCLLKVNDVKTCTHTRKPKIKMASENKLTHLFHISAEDSILKEYKMLRHQHHLPHHHHTEAACLGCVSFV